VELTNIIFSLRFVVMSPQIPPTRWGNVEKIYQNISAKNAFRIIAPCDFALGNPVWCTDARFLGD
jgi:hypothetical protein